VVILRPIVVSWPNVDDDAALPEIHGTSLFVRQTVAADLSLLHEAHSESERLGESHPPRLADMPNRSK
jgi:hypothetical protein